MDTLKHIICNDLHLSFESVSMQPVESGASSKKYFLLSGLDPERFTDLFMVMQAPAETLSDYLNIAHFLERNLIRCPLPVYQNLSQSYIIMEHCGTQTLQKRVTNASKDLTVSAYKKAIDVLLMIQKAQPDSTCIASGRFFDVQKFLYEYEFHLCSKLIHNHFRYNLSPNEKGVLDGLYRILSSELTKQPFVTVHRDFQSSNLLFKDEELVVTDFQDARMGLSLYDLVSLIEDVYVTLDAVLKEELINYYIASAREWRISVPSKADFQRIYDLTLIQRKLHDAGAFAFCFENFGNQKYLAYINTALLQALDVMTRYTNFREAHELITMICHANPPKK